MRGAALRHPFRRLAVSPKMRALRDRWKNGRGTPCFRLLPLRYFTQLAFRFSKKAETPSIASGFSQVSARRRIVSSITSESMRGPMARASAFEAATAPGAVAR